MCSTVASSPILVVQLAERALTAGNQSQNHLLLLYVDTTLQCCARHMCQNSWGFLWVPRVTMNCLSR